MKKILPIIGAIFAGILMYIPEKALAASTAAWIVWKNAVAPAMLPFMAVMPLLTGEEAKKFYKAFFGWMMRPIFGISGEFAPAMLIGMLSGSPSGMMANARIAGNGCMAAREFKRSALSFTGVGMIFLLSGVGVAMFGEKRVGMILVITQITSQFVMALILRNFFRQDGQNVPKCREEGSGNTIRETMVTLLQICGYMMLFGVISAAIENFFGENIGKWMLVLLDFPSGAAYVSGLALPMRVKIAILGGSMGFGGLCIACQNMAIARPMGLRWREYIAVKLANAGICAGIAWMLYPMGEILPTMGRISASKPLPVGGFLMAILALPIATSCIINKSNLANGSGRKSSKSARCSIK